ncbi:MAG TPA: metallophosphoesterase, partial [Verrucomicrobiae bacterium]
WSAFPQDATKAAEVPDKQVSWLPGELADWYLLDSLEVAAKASGEIGAAQLAWLGQALDSRPQKPAVVMVHHNPLFTPTGSGLIDTAALMEVLAPRRQVKVLIFGHTHDWHVGVHESGIHLVNLPPTSYPFKEGRPNGWVRATLKPQVLEVELRALDHHHPEHGQKQVLMWRA